MSTEELVAFIDGKIPDVGMNPLNYIFEQIELKQGDRLWLEFGVYKGTSINYIASKTTGQVFGFDSFEGLPEDWRPKYDKGAFDLGGEMPTFASNVVAVKGYFDVSLGNFLATHAGNIGFVHIDCDLYSSAKYVLDNIKDRLADGCVILFDELVNFEYFEGPRSELRALYEWTKENDIQFEWIGMRGPLDLTLTKGVKGYYYPYGQNVAIRIRR
jgi:hypothetical protein